MIRKLSGVAGWAAALTLLWTAPALAAPATTIQGPDGTQANVDSSTKGLEVKCVSGCSGGGGSSVITGPLGSQAPANGVSVTPDTTTETHLSNIDTATAASATAAAQTTGNGSLATIATNTTGAATATNQTAVQANAGSSASKAEAVQGLSGGVAVGVGVQTSTGGGATPFHVLSAASNNATLVSTGAHTLYTLVIIGTNTAIGDVRLYDSASSPTCSSATGVIANLPVIASTGAPMAGVAVPIPAQGIKFSNGLGYCITGANADNDNTNAPTGINVSGTYQ